MCDRVTMPLLGRIACITLGIVKLNVPSEIGSKSISAVQEKSSTNFENDIISSFPEVFNGLGCLKSEPVSIELKGECVPFHLSAPRRVPIPLLSQLRDELERIQAMGVIKRQVLFDLHYYCLVVTFIVVSLILVFMNIFHLDKFLVFVRV